MRAKELLAYTLLSIHNVTELIRFTQAARQAILEERFVAFAAEWEQRLVVDAEEPDAALL